MTDATMSEGLADVIAALHHDARGTAALVPTGEDPQLGCVALAAAAHAMRAGHAALGNKGGGAAAMRVFPWRLEKFKAATFSFDAGQARANQRRDLVRAAALLVKAIDELDRAAAAPIREPEPVKG